MVNSEITLNKYIADSGICSRRQAAEFIKDGLVLVNNVPTKEPGYRVKEKDSIKYNGKLVRPRPKVYIMVNKPRGYISSLSDPLRNKTVVSLVQNATKDRVYPIGRLDVETTGLIILTNDGEVAQRLAHPRYEVRKIYHVKLNRELHEEDMQEIRDGMLLSDGRIISDRIYYVAGKDRKYVGIELHSGKNRIVRRIFNKLGYEVEILDRVGYAGLSKKGLSLGSWRFLTKAEIDQLNKNVP